METEVIEQQTQTQETQQAPVFTASSFGTNLENGQDTQINIQEQAAETQQEQETQQVVNEEQEENVSTFSMDSFASESVNAEEGNQESVQNSVQIDWKEEVKKQDRREVLKAAGLSDFAIDFAEYYESGNDPYKYLEAKAFDWDKVGDIDVLKQDYKSQYPTFDESQIERLIAKKYGFIEGGDEEDNADALLMAKADAHVSRQAKKAEQQKFKIPQLPVKEQEVQATAEAKVQELVEQQRQIAEQDYQQVVKFYQEHEATKSLLDQKKLGIDLGLEKPFYFKVDKPELITKALTDGEFWQRITASNPQEVDSSKLIPDVNKLQSLILKAMNPNYEKDLFNYGKSQGVKSVIEEGQNARRPNSGIPATPKETLAEAWGRATVTTFGR
jgi:hypothetical protein